MFSDELKEKLLELGITADVNDPDKIRDKILARLASLHPDKTGGNFINAEQQDGFQHLLKILEKLDGFIE